MAKKRAFVRYSKNGKIVPGSLILTSGSYPSGPSTWKEVPADLCCEFTCNCFEITAVWDGNNFKSLRYYDCNGVLVENSSLDTGQTITVCAQRIDQAWSAGYYTWVDNGLCVSDPACPVVNTTSTTTTTTAPPVSESTTTTTTTETPVSDERLKENIVATGGKVGQFNEYTWDWNETAKSLGLDHYPTTGVIAQEVLEVMPEATVFDETIGYYRVNYNMISND